ncbi:MAG: serine/threonine protein kinase [Planctomycetes bacterium]|nr:serine/threonine protein kinase [Planctomycetota bacterium]
MSATPAPDDWSQLEQALERYFLAQEQGDTVDLDAICGGDEQLAQRIRQALRTAPGLVTSSRTQPAAPAPLRSFGDFDVLELIGRGGMGTVYLARQRSLGRQVALKILDRSAAEEPTASARLRREAELTAHLEHPNIVPVYAVGEIDGVPFLAMKHLLGPSLAECARPWPPERVARAGVALAEALDAAHVQGIVHRDVKPANILLDGDTPVFVDFGLARAQSDPTLTQEGKVAGTLRYMAPERLEAGTAVLDPRIDVYGLGATLYELLAGRELFGDGSPTALVRAVIARDPAPLRLRGRDVDLETVVMRALAKEPQRRFATARELADDLRRYLRGEPVRSRNLSRTARAVRLMRRFPRASAALAAALLVAVVAITVALTQQFASAADRDRRLQVARSDLAEFRHARAHDHLALLARRHPDDDEVATALAGARIELAIDRLFEVAVDHGANIAAEQVDDLLAVFDGATGLRRHPLAAFAAVVALGQRGDQASARDQLAQLAPAERDSRLGRAVAAWIAPAPRPWTLPPAANDRAPGTAVLTALVLRSAGAPPDDVMAELATDGVRQSPRRKLFEAIVRLDLGQTEHAVGLLRGLAGPDAAPVVWRWLANAELRMGDLPAATEALANATADHSPAADYLRLQLAFEQAEQLGGEDGTAARAALFEQLANDPQRTDWQERFLAEYEGKTNPERTAAACERLARLADRTAHPYGREMLTAHRIEITGWNLPEPAADHPAPTQHRALLAEWQERAEALCHPAARAIAATWIARSLCCSERPGDLARGLELFQGAAENGIGNPRLALEYAGAVGALDDTKVDAYVLRTHALAARDALGRELARVDSGRQRLPRQLVGELCRFALLMAWRAEDPIDVWRRFPRAEPWLQPEELAGARELARWAAEAVTAFRRH